MYGLDFQPPRPILSIRRVSMMKAMASLLHNLALATQGLIGSDAKVSDLLVVLVTVASWILVPRSIHGLLIIRMPLAVQILIHND